MTKNVRKVLDSFIAAGSYEMAARYLEIEARTTGKASDLVKAREMRARADADSELNTIRLARAFM
jgi:hypothetical protein